MMNSVTSAMSSVQLDSEVVTLAPDLSERGANDHVFVELGSICSGKPPKPFPAGRKDGCNQNNTVRMPFSSKCGSAQVALVKEGLKKLSEPQNLIDDVSRIIDLYQPGRLNYEALYTLFRKILPLDLCRHYLYDVYPKIAKLALRLDELITKPIPLLMSGKSGSVTFSQEQVACVLANAFLCTFPDPQLGFMHHKTYINFSLMFGRGRKCKPEKLRCMLHYFDCVTKNMPTGLISVRRHCINDQVDFTQSEAQICDLHVFEEGRIEDTGDQMLEIDFANKFIGGGVLNSGAVQEEIRFMISPELIISMLVCERMAPNEVISIVGSQRFSDYKGYGDSFVYVERKQSEPVVRDRFNRIVSEVIAMNATSFSNAPFKQLHEESILGEIMKAYVGFDHVDTLNRPIATGNWGCGVFKGDKQLKSLIQIAAASIRGRKEVNYFTFNDAKLTQELRGVHKLLIEKKVTAGELVRLLVTFKDSCKPVKPDNFAFFEFIAGSLSLK